MTTTNGTPTISPVQQIESMYARLEKARPLYAEGKVHPIVGMEGHYAVECSRIDGGMYLVNRTCTCVDAQQRADIHHGWCKHKLAVELLKEQQASDPKVNQPITKPTISESEGSLEDQLSDLYPKATRTDFTR
jgi:hypothetical protein